MMTFGAFNLIFSGAQTAPTYLSMPAHAPLQTEQFLALQAGSMMMLAGALLAIITWTCDDTRTIRLTVTALAISDVPHCVFGLWCLGPLAWEPQSWSVEMKAYMGVPAITFCVKVAYLMGWLGRDSVSVKKQQ